MILKKKKKYNAYRFLGPYIIYNESMTKHYNEVS
jgi:hypothetical protein